MQNNLMLQENIEVVYKKLIEISNLNSESFLAYEKFLIFDKGDYLDRFVEGKKFPPFQIDLQMSSSCNLGCRWCVGSVTAQKNNNTEIASNSLTQESVDKIIQNIVDFKDGELGVETVLFSGFTGEPLIKRELAISAMSQLKDANINVGLFTNGVLMTPETWETLLRIESINVSLDGGPESWVGIKQPNSKNGKNTLYNRVIKNIEGICLKKKELDSSTEISIGYTVTHDNAYEIDGVASLVKSLGANSICLKHDITGTDFVGGQQEYDMMINSINECKEKYEDNNFKVLIMHESGVADIKNNISCSDCNYRKFFGTIGSDGQMYPCDYQTLPGRPTFGEVSKSGLQNLWDAKTRDWKNAMQTDFSHTCPPFAIRANKFLSKLEEIKEEYGTTILMLALEKVRKEKKDMVLVEK